jgi:hypothetical protein
MDHLFSLIQRVRISYYLPGIGRHRSYRVESILIHIPESYNLLLILSCIQNFIVSTSHIWAPLECRNFTGILQESVHFRRKNAGNRVFSRNPKGAAIKVPYSPT